MKRKILLIVSSILEISLVIIVVIAYYLSEKIYIKNGIHIPKSVGTNYIINEFKKNGTNISKLDIKIYNKLGGLKSGYIESQTITRLDLLNSLTKTKLVNITIIPGDSSYHFLQKMADKLNLSKDKLLKYYYQKTKYQDGIFIAETYKVAYGISEKTLISFIYNQSIAIHKRLAKKYLGYYNKKKWIRYLIIASIIQKEAGNRKEMPIISAVIYNRLKRGMKLQMDGTLNYGKYSHKSMSAKRLKVENSPYNTYKNYGLPPKPLCSVSKYSIKASIKPTKANYLYFVASNRHNGHIFAKTYKQHLKNIKKVRNK